MKLDVIELSLSASLETEEHAGEADLHEVLENGNDHDGSHLEGQLISTAKVLRPDDVAIDSLNAACDLSLDEGNVEEETEGVEELEHVRLHDQGFLIATLGLMVLIVGQPVGDGRVDDVEHHDLNGVEDGGDEGGHLKDPSVLILPPLVQVLSQYDETDDDTQHEEYEDDVDDDEVECIIANLIYEVRRFLLQRGW